MADPLVAVTGTPGTGKTAATRRLHAPVIHGNDLVRSAGLDAGTDPDRDSLIVDLDAFRARVGDRAAATDGPLVVESHLAHHVAADRVVVLRCHPSVVERRLRDRGETVATARENAESEALDIVLSAAVARHGEASVYEVDTTDMTVESVADAIRAVVAGTRDPAAGIVDWPLAERTP